MKRAGAEAADARPAQLPRKETAGQAQPGACSHAGQPTAGAAAENKVFFFVKLSGRTLTCEVPLSLTGWQLLDHLASERGAQGVATAALSGRCMLTRGGRVLALDATLAANGVDRDCTLDMVVRVRSTAHPALWRVPDHMSKLLQLLDERGRLTGAALAHNAAQCADVELCIGAALSDALGDAGALQFKGAAIVGEAAVAEQLPPLQEAAALSLHIATHSQAPALGYSRKAVMWLKLLAGWARGVLSTPGVSSGRLLHLTVHVAAGLLQLQLAATAMLLRLLYYSNASSTLLSDGPDGSGVEQLERLTYSCLQPLIDWLARAPPGLAGAASLTAPKLDAAVQAVGPDTDVALLGGLCTLLALPARCSARQLAPVAALLQCITLMVADRLHSSMAAALLQLPGVPGLAAAAERLQLRPGCAPRPGICDRAVALPAEEAVPDGLLFQLHTLCQASLLLQPAMETAAANSVQLGGSSWAAAVGPGSAASVAASMLRHVEAVGAARVAAAATGAGLDLPGPPGRLFAGPRAAVWGFLDPLLTAMDTLAGFAKFAAANDMGAGAAGTNGAFLPGWLLDDVCRLLEVHTLCVRLCGDTSPPAAARRMLQHELLAPWLTQQLEELLPEQVPLDAADAQTDMARTAHGLASLLSWAPQLVDSLPEAARRAWLLCAAFPPPRAADSSDSDEDEEGGALLVVHRERLLEDSYSELLNLAPEECRRQLRVHFAGEVAEGQGVLSEWLVQLSAALADPAAALLETAAQDKAALHINQLASVQPDWHSYLRVLGRVLGLALRHRVPLGFSLSSALFKALAAVQVACDKPCADCRRVWLLSSDWHAAASTAAAAAWPSVLASQASSSSSDEAGRNLAMAWDVAQHACIKAGTVQLRFASRLWRQPLSLDDLRQLDPELAEGLQGLRDNPSTAPDLELTWVAPAAAAMLQADNGLPQGAAAAEAELVAGGAQLAVSEADAVAFVAARANHRLLGGSNAEGVLWLAAGLLDVAEPAAAALSQGWLLLLLDEATLNAALRGQARPLRVAEWRAASTCCGRLQQQHAAVAATFWKAVAQLSDDERRLLLRFWTGLTHLPATGFVGLGRKLQLTALESAVPGAASGDAGSEARPLALLPRSHTCFLQLQLPVAWGSDVGVALRALRAALTHVDHFGIA